MVCFIAAAPVFAAFYKESAVKHIARVMAFGLMAQMLANIHLAIMKRRMEFFKVAVNIVVARTLSTVLAVLMALNLMAMRWIGTYCSLGKGVIRRKRSTHCKSGRVDSGAEPKRDIVLRVKKCLTCLMLNPSIHKFDYEVI